MTEPERFQRNLTEHFPLPMEWIVGGGVVTEHDLDADADSFLAFASALGIKPPNPGSGGDADVPSASSQ